MGQILGILNPELSCRSGVRWRSWGKFNGSLMGSFFGLLSERLCFFVCDCDSLFFFSLSMFFCAKKIQIQMSCSLRRLQFPCWDCQPFRSDIRPSTPNPLTAAAFCTSNIPRFCVETALWHAAMAEFHHPNVPENEAPKHLRISRWWFQTCFTFIPT